MVSLDSITNPHGDRASARSAFPVVRLGTMREGGIAVSGVHFPHVAAAKFAALAKVAAVDSAFRVPDVVDIDKHSVSTTWIPGLEAAVDLVRKRKKLYALSSGAGKALAQIHAYLAPPTPSLELGAFERWMPVKHRETMSHTPAAFAHGDFGLTNVHLAADGMVVVLDPFPNGFSSDRVWSYESIYFDIASFVGGLASRAGKTQLFRPASRTRLQAAALFIHAYEEESAITLDLEILAKVCEWHDIRYAYGFVGGVRGAVRYQLSKVHRRTFFHRLAN